MHIYNASSIRNQNGVPFRKVRLYRLTILQYLTTWPTKSKHAAQIRDKMRTPHLDSQITMTKGYLVTMLQRSLLQPDAETCRIVYNIINDMTTSKQQYLHLSIMRYDNNLHNRMGTEKQDN